MQTVHTSIKQRVKDKLAAGIAIAEKHYGIKIKFPTILYGLKGKTAGYADYKKWTVQFNDVLLSENADDFIARTVPHELAHLINHLVNPEDHETRMVKTYAGWKRTKRDVHGEGWQGVMTVLGVDDISRCHQYDTTNSKVQRNVPKYTYACSCCKTTMEVGAKVHNRIQQGAGYEHKRCRGSKLVFVGAVQPVQPVVTPSATPTHSPTQGSKIQRCYALYKQYSARYGRKDMINVFVQECDCTNAGASTYYATCKKMYESGVL